MNNLDLRGYILNRMLGLESVSEGKIIYKKINPTGSNAMQDYLTNY